MGVSYNGSYKRKRKRLVDSWLNNNIYKMDNVDMAGLIIDDNNFASVHHILDRKGTCLGYAVIGRFLHNYIDSYLRSINKVEYYKWNELLLDFSQIAPTFYYNNLVNDLSHRCTSLLINIKLNKDSRASKMRKALLPYIDASLSKINLLLYISYNQLYQECYHLNNYIPSVRLETKSQKEKRNCELLNISQNDIHVAIAEYLKSNPINDCWLDDNGNVDLLHRIQYKELNTVLNQNDNKEGLDIKINKRFHTSHQWQIARRFDWMGMPVTLNNIAKNNELFITDFSSSVLIIIKKLDMNLYKEWMTYFKDIKNDRVNKCNLYNKLTSLRKKTARCIVRKGSSITPNPDKYKQFINAFRKNKYLSYRSSINFQTYNDEDLELEIEEGSYTRTRV